jgi:hypothetical protein
VAAIGVRLHSKERWSYNVLVVQKRKGKVTIVERKSGIENEDELQRFIPNNTPVLITIEGWGVLIKQAQFNDEGAITSQLVPNVNDFELYPFRQGDNGFVAIIRSETLQEVYGRLQTSLKDIIGLSVGPMAMFSLIKLLSLEGRISAGAYQIILDREKVSGIKAQVKDELISYKFKEDVVTSIHLPLLGQCISFFDGQRNADTISLALLQEYSYKKLMVFTGWVVLGALFIGLFINYLFFDHYNKSFNQISGQYSLNESILKRLKEAELELKVKQELVMKGGLEGQTQFAWYTDRIIELMPQHLILNKLSVHPSDGKIKMQKEIVFQENILLIEGETKEVLAIHHWLQKLKEEEWVKEVDMVYYGQEEPNESASFNLELIF